MSAASVEHARDGRLPMVRVPPWIVSVWLATAVYAALLSVESIHDHRAFRTGFDSAIYDQRLWLLSQFENPFSTVVSRPFLADHFEPGLVLLTPLYWLGLGLPGLLTAQAVALALTAPALYALARACGAQPSLASIPALLWLISSAVAAVNLFDVRPATFAPVLIVLSVLAVKTDRMWLLATTTFFALTLKEDIALLYLVLGLILVVREGRRKAGGALIAASLATAVLASTIIRALGEQYEWQGRRFAGDRGDSFFDALVWIVRNPLDTLGNVVGHSGADLVVLVLSTGGLALLAPSWLLLSAPSAVYNALSAYEPQHNLIHHYHLLTLTGIFVAAAIGAVRLGELRPNGRRFFAGGLAGAFAVALAGGIAQHDVGGRLSSSERAELRRALDRIPSGVPVAAAPNLLPHLSQRVEVYSLPEPFVPLDWGSPLSRREMAERARDVRFVAFADTNKPTEFDGDMADVLASLLDRRFRVVARSSVGGVVVLERD